MQVWLFDIMVWPAAGPRSAIPFPGTEWDARTGLEAYHGNLRYLQRADELGYDGICLAEHHFKAFGICPSPNVMAAVVASHTSHAKIVVLGNCLPLHGHPVRVAEELALVDVLSRGRLVSGFIRGGSTEWYVYNVDPTEARGRFEEAWDLIVRCWTEPEPFAWHGQHYHYDSIAIMPRPIQQPHPPIVMAGSTAESVEWAARHRVPLASSFAPTASMRETFEYYRQYAREVCGWTPGPEHAIVSRQVYVAPTNARARADAEPHLLGLFAEVAPGRQLPPEVERYRAGGRTPRSFAYKSAEQRHWPEGQTGHTFESLQHDGYCIVGDPDYVSREILRQQHELGVGTFLTYIPFSTLPLDQATRSIELFAAEVLPHLRDSDPPIVRAPVGDGTVP